MKYEDVIQGWAERSGNKMFSDYMDGNNDPRGYSESSAAVVVMLAFPRETENVSKEALQWKLHDLATAEFNRILSRDYNTKD